MRPVQFLRRALGAAHRLILDPASARERLRRALGLEEPPVETPPMRLEGKDLEETARTLQGMLAEIDELSDALPVDARAIGLAARSLVERSLEECRKPVVDALLVARDMEQVSVLAVAMRERLLLNPRPAPPSRPS